MNFSCSVSPNFILPTIKFMHFKSFSGIHMNPVTLIEFSRTFLACLIFTDAGNVLEKRCFSQKMFLNILEFLL